MKPKPNHRVLPAHFKNVIEADFILRPTFRERLAILIGCNLELKYLGRTEHSPGRMDHNLVHKVVNKF